VFRYLVLAWDPLRPDCSARIVRLRHRLLRSGEWSPSIDVPGLFVATTGSDRRNNGAWPLTSGRGVILGRLFDAQVADTPPCAGAPPSGPSLEAVARTSCASLIESHWGRYVAVLRGDAGITVVRDPGGALPCFVRHIRGVWLVFSWLEDSIDLLGPEGVPPLDWEAIRALLLLGALGGHATALDGVTAVLPGQRVRLGAHAARGEMLWAPAAIARDPLDLPASQAADLLLQTTERCVGAWAGAGGRILLRLSGGVDSAIVLACLTKTRDPESIICLNYHSPGADGDERGYARQAASMAGCRLIEAPRDTGYRLERVLAMALTPCPTSIAGRLTADTDAAHARSVGAPAMFTGGGGDQLYFEFRRWWPAADYLRLRGFGPGFLRAAMSAARLGGQSVWQTLRLALSDQLRRGAPSIAAGGSLSLAGPGLMDGTPDLARFVHPLGRAAHGLPIGKSVQLSQLLFPMEYYDPIARQAAPELVNPLLSQPLVELCLRLPTYLLTEGGQPRGLARLAFAHRIPRAIALRRSKGGMEEHLSTVVAQNRDVVRTLLLEGQLVRRGLIDRRRVEEALSTARDAPAASTAEILSCVGIEAWLARHEALRKSAGPRPES
jgi:asparagine synthase (glutamine-hydrolysing)